MRDAAGTPIAKAAIDYEESEAAGTIIQLVTHPDFQGQGHARRLIAEAEARIRGRGLQRARLAVEPDNSRALGLYEFLGYRRVGMREGGWEYERDDGSLDWYRTVLIDMEKQL